MSKQGQGIPKNQKPYLKIILVGDSGVGKTCLISSYFKQSFEHQSIPTVAPAYSCSDVKRKDGSVVSLQIWDTAGQERYHSVSKLFFRDSSLAFICFDAGDEDSTSNIPNWIKRVYDEVPNCQFFLVLTKSDLHTKDELAQLKKEIQGKYSDPSIKGFYITSALEREGVQEIFNDAAEVYVSKAKEQPAKPVEVEQKEKKGCC